MGPTASGKSSLAEKIADALDAILLNADSFQVYRYLDIGTAKPTVKEQYRLLDLKDPNESFGVGEWVHLAQQELELAWERRQSVVIVGGTGLNIRALMERYGEMSGPPSPELRDALNQKLEREGLHCLVEELGELDPIAFARVDLKNPVRVIRALERAKSPKIQMTVEIPPFNSSKIAISIQTALLDERIDQRVGQMVQNGWAREIEQLRKMGFLPSDPGLRAIGYRAMWRAAEGEINSEEAIAMTVLETRRYAKRQRTWLRSEPNLRWLFDGPEFDLMAQVSNLLAIDLN